MVSRSLQHPLTMAGAGEIQVAANVLSIMHLPTGMEGSVKMERCVISAMATMTYWHSAHHLVRLAVKPDVVDEIIITTHTMIGGERTRSATRFDVVPNKYASQVRVR